MMIITNHVFPPSFRFDSTVGDYGYNGSSVMVNDGHFATIHHYAGDKTVVCKYAAINLRNGAGESWYRRSVVKSKFYY